MEGRRYSKMALGVIISINWVVPLCIYNRIVCRPLPLEREAMNARSELQTLVHGGVRLGGVAHTVTALTNIH